MEIQISVRNLVEFVLRSGNIDNRRAAVSDNAMAEGGRIHRMIQRRMGANYHAEVTLRHMVETEKYTILIEGRADGIMIDAVGDIARPPELTEHHVLPAFKDSVTVTIDEIKGTYRDIHKMKEAAPVHLAQAKCYAYIYSKQNHLAHIRVRMTYCNIDTEEIRYFHYEFDSRELEEWFEGVMEKYRRWADFQVQWEEIRTDSIKQLAFPFSYRSGQKELVTYVYQTVYHRKKLFVEAPTGVGKTISTLFPSVKAMGEGLCRKIFYLTAKTITRTVANDTLQIMRDKGLKLKSVVLTAKDKICFMEETECNPEYCPYARGHFDRVNDAMYDLLMAEDDFSRENIEKYAMKHQVCPFEMCLDMSLFADAVIGDYNYLFDPHVYLKRFFTEGVREDYIFLIDEAHNLVERGREMYSAVLIKEDFLALRKIVKDYDAKMYKQLEKCNHELLELKRQCEDCVILSDSDILPFGKSLMRLAAGIEAYLEDHDDSPVKKDILEFYFEVSHFLMIYECLDENYVIYAQLQSDDSFALRLFCVNPSGNLRDCMMRGRSSILFSATLLPIQYYKKLLGASEGDYEVYAKSVFLPEQKGLFIASDVTSKYSRRSDMEYYNIASYLHKVVMCKKGNYMAFFPSYAFLQNVYQTYLTYFLNDTGIKCLVQEEYMDEQTREEFLKHFVPEEDKTLLGFCVLGGIFSEGIDLKNDSLIGALIVGTGLPMVCNEREILRGYFEEQDDGGFDYAYKYPGMNKVLQAAGRVIRTVEDEGIIVLLDERFLSPSYLRMFPREWENYERVTLQNVDKAVGEFWKRRKLQNKNENEGNSEK